MRGRGLDWSHSREGQVTVCSQHGTKPFWFRKILEISSIADELLASQEGLCSMELADKCMHTSALAMSTAVCVYVRLILVMCLLHVTGMWTSTAYKQ
jgi:hypothetical protein